jgi:hypothetical protein
LTKGELRGVDRRRPRMSASPRDTRLNRENSQDANPRCPGALATARESLEI